MAARFSCVAMTLIDLVPAGMFSTLTSRVGAREQLTKAATVQRPRSRFFLNISYPSAVGLEFHHPQAQIALGILGCLRDTDGDADHGCCGDATDEAPEPAALVERVLLLLGGGQEQRRLGLLALFLAGLGQRFGLVGA